VEAGERNERGAPGQLRGEKRRELN